MRGPRRAVRDRLPFPPAAAAIGSIALPGCDALGTDAGSAPVFGLLLLLALSALALGYLTATLRARRDIAAATLRAEAAAALDDAVLWETDPDGRLRRWLAPPRAAFGAPGSRLDQCFDGGPDAAALATALAHGSAFDALRVRSRMDGSAWLIGARPLRDGAGRPAGFVGIARPQDGLVDRAVLQALGEAVGMPMAVAERDGAGAWHLTHANAAARTKLGLGPESTLPAPVPPTLLTVLGERAGDQRLAGGWRSTPFGHGHRHGAVLSAPDPGGTDPGDAAAFSYTISHDLRAPIRVVEGFTRIVKEDYGPTLDRVANDHLDRVLGAVARMNQMIDAMLTLARLSSQPLARQSVDLSQLAGYVVDELRRAAPERAAEVEIEPGMIVQGDPTLLRQVLDNLLGNAWKYTAKRPVARIVFGQEQQNGRRVFVVRDNGAGFDMRSVERLFGLFQRLHSHADFPGTGVGLASVRRIVRRHGGEIWADAEPGRGAAFHFTLGA